MDVTGRIRVAERTAEALTFALKLVAQESAGFEAAFTGETYGVTVEMMRWGETPDEAISNLKSAMTKAGINWTLEE